jgi:small multidrug resistance pump
MWNVYWLILAAAIVLEVLGTTSMKLSQGFTRLVPSVAIFVFYGLSFYALTIAIKEIDISVAYAVWAGLGTALIALIGICWFKEAFTLIKALSLVLIVIGVIGLNLSGSSH